MAETTQIFKIQLKGLAELKRAGTDASSNDVLYYYKLNKKLGFVNGSGSAVSTATTVTLWYYRVPISGEETSNSIEPIIDSRWDNALCYGACFDLTGNEKWLLLYERELDRVRSLELAQNDRSFQVPANEEYN